MNSPVPERRCASLAAAAAAAAASASCCIASSLLPSTASDAALAIPASHAAASFFLGLGGIIFHRIIRYMWYLVWHISVNC